MDGADDLRRHVVRDLDLDHVRAVCANLGQKSNPHPFGRVLTAEPGDETAAHSRLEARGRRQGHSVLFCPRALRWVRVCHDDLSLVAQLAEGGDLEGGLTEQSCVDCGQLFGVGRGREFWIAPVDTVEEA